MNKPVTRGLVDWGCYIAYDSSSADLAGQAGVPRFLPRGDSTWWWVRAGL